MSNPTALDRSPCPHCCTPMVNGRCPDPNCAKHWPAREVVTSNSVNGWLALLRERTVNPTALQEIGPLVAAHIEDQHLSLQAASIFIREVYEAVHGKPLQGDIANLTLLSQQVISEIERWKVAVPDETSGEWIPLDHDLIVNGEPVRMRRKGSPNIPQWEMWRAVKSTCSGTSETAWSESTTDLGARK